MAVATLRWSDWDFQPGVSARMTWDVISTNPADVTTADGIFQAYSTHPLDASLVADAPAATREGPNFYRVSVSFKGPQAGAGGSTTPLDPDPLKQLPTIGWNIGVTNEQFNRDIYGNLVTNAAGEAIANPLDDEVLSLGWTITKNFAKYDATLPVRFMNCTNENDFTFLTYTFEKRKVLCKLIAPKGEYTLAAKFVPVSFTFEWRPDGWQWRVPNLGRNGWYVDELSKGGKPVFGPLFRRGEPVNDPVPLNEDGTPVNKEIKLTSSNHAPVPAPTALPDTVERETGSDGTVFLFFRRKKSVDFSALPL